jgi:hypothetical protein
VWWILSPRGSDRIEAAAAALVNAAKKKLKEKNEGSQVKRLPRQS